MRFSLRTLLIAMLLLGPTCAWGWKKHVEWQKQRELEESRIKFDSLVPAGSGLSQRSTLYGFPASEGDVQRINAEWEAKLDDPDFVARQVEFRPVISQINSKQLPE